MRTTLKRIEVGSAFRVGFILYGLLFAIFGLFFVLLQGAMLNWVTNMMRGSTFDTPNVPNTSVFMGAGLLGALCFYGVGIVFAAIMGGIQGAVIAFCYNLTANWIGGLKIELQTEDTDLLDNIERDSYKPKRDEL